MCDVGRRERGREQEVRNWVAMQLYNQADQAAALDFTTINHDILSRKQLDTSAVSLRPSNTTPD